VSEVLPMHVDAIRNNSSVTMLSSNLSRPEPGDGHDGDGVNVHAHRVRRPNSLHVRAPREGRYVPSPVSCSTHALEPYA